jgi:hypothetical protein
MHCNPLLLVLMKNSSLGDCRLLVVMGKGLSGSIHFVSMKLKIIRYFYLEEHDGTCFNILCVIPSLILGF